MIANLAALAGSRLEFAGETEETILARTKLLDYDLDMFTDRASQLAANLSGLADALIKIAENAPDSDRNRAPFVATE